MYLTPQKEMPSKEELETMDPEEHEQFVADYYSGAYAKAGLKPTAWNKAKYRFGTLIKLGGGLIAIVVLYGIINLVLVGGQSLFHGADKKELNELKQELDKEMQIISILEAGITSKESDLNALKNEIDATDDADAHNILVDEYNSKLPAYNISYNSYTAKLVSYNQKVDRANVLAKKIGSTYYVIPIPR